MPPPARKEGSLPVKQDAIETVFDIGKELGTGHFSVVKLATHKEQGKEFALKIIDKRKLGNQKERVLAECDILHSCDHVNIVKLHDIYENENKLYLVMELVNGGELFDRIVEKGSYTEKDAANLVAKICSAVDYLHSKSIAHRDLKPENLLYASAAADAEIKLADFGLSTYAAAGSSTLKTACGTPGYVAPEVLRNKGYGLEVDMWSVGVITYILLCGFPPFYEENTAQLFESIMSANYDFPSPYWDEVSQGAKDLIQKLLVVDPKERLTAAQVLKDDWIRNASDSAVLSTTYETIRKFNARRKFKMGIIASISVNRMKRMASTHKG
eukprot:TRINITY_DN358_c0_g1_i1.p2 TRINITY_DN358_c0_g1~~TRINITY_DN358_c0_g1_i1.p2  ORF type:complete len:327 (+),score=164.53 TRINITY_DN358_c0_g1_i1:87-1067(+)